jgi:hypothetical protein
MDELIYDKSSTLSGPPVTLLGPIAEVAATTLTKLFARYDLTLNYVTDQQAIPGSYWGAPEAGLRGNQLFVRADTPLNSVLHEASHFLCMDAARRNSLDRDAGGDDLEECAVCYLSLLLADLVPGYSLPALLRDMDSWGYSFRLGSAAAWFAGDAADARAWLYARGWVDQAGALTFPAAV